MVILGLAVLVLAARFLILESHRPGLKDVLAQNPPQNSFDPSLWVASMLAFSLAALSVAKGYEIFQRNRSVAVALIPEEEEEGLAQEINPDGSTEGEELKRIREALLLENSEYKEQVKKAHVKIEEISQVEQILRRSNIALGKECERLKAENEEFQFRINALKIKPVRKKSKRKLVKSKKLKRKTKK